MRRAPLVALLLLALFAGPSAAEFTGLLGIYVDAEGTDPVFGSLTVGEPFDLYVVLHTEDRVNAVSYTLEVGGLGQDLFLLDSSFGPDGGGLNLPTTNGENVGLGVCEIGFGGNPILVAKYTFVFPFHTDPWRILRVVPNPDSDPTGAQYSTCQGELKLADCDYGIIFPDIATDDSSWGAVKALY